MPGSVKDGSTHFLYANVIYFLLQKGMPTRLGGKRAGKAGPALWPLHVWLWARSRLAQVQQRARLRVCVAYIPA